MDSRGRCGKWEGRGVPIAPTPNPEGSESSSDERSACMACAYIKYRTQFLFLGKRKGPQHEAAGLFTNQRRRQTSGNTYIVMSIISATALNDWNISSSNRSIARLSPEVKGNSLLLCLEPIERATLLGSLAFFLS